MPVAMTSTSAGITTGLSGSWETELATGPHRPDKDGDRDEEAHGSQPRISSRLQPGAPLVAPLHKNVETLMAALQ